MSEQKKDHWSSEAYAASASFVPNLTQKILAWLSPRATDRVLDIGCGDGKFTAKFIDHVGYVLGIDASPAMVDAANKSYRSEKAEFRVVDCRYLEREEDIISAGWDKIISNAALHWILRDESTRTSTVRAIHAALRPGGRFIFEQGGHGNVGEALTAFLAVLSQPRYGFSVARLREISPWYFATEDWMRRTLEEVGFVVEQLEIEYRPTRLTEDDNGKPGSSGLEGWIRLMGAQFLEALKDDAERDAAVAQICEVLDPVVTREDGSRWLGYVRLRGVARKV
ncbi:hypothetical protein VTN49DRAFT_3190 [Thermomyces lanuginosus]|uniref:uncharacterized protein n=1 Tax=Thermomyces lanuginosus TaxID=5541 RepID=UPI0037424B7F